MYLFSLETISSSNVANTSQLIKLTNFGFSIPAGATIDSVSFDVVAGWGCGFGYDQNTYLDTDLIPARNNWAKLVVGGTAVGSNKNKGELPRPYTTHTFTGNNVYWGVTLPTQAQINASDFGLELQFDAFIRSAAFASSIGPVTLFVQSVICTVNYTLAGSSITAVRQWDPETSIRLPGVSTSGKLAAYRFTQGGAAWKGARFKNDLETGFLVGEFALGGNADRFFFGLDAGIGTEFNASTLVPSNATAGAVGFTVVAGTVTALIWDGTTLVTLALGPLASGTNYFGIRYTGISQPIEFYFNGRKHVIPTQTTPPYAAKLGPVIVVGASAAGSGFIDARKLAFGKNLTTLGF